jgi:hypothetical protein
VFQPHNGGEKAWPGTDVVILKNSFAQKIGKNWRVLLKLLLVFVKS